MDILVFGAGVEGSIFGAKLAAAGNAVTMVARGDRFKDLRSKGVQLRNVLTGELSATPVAVVEHIDSTTSADLALVTVRREQVEGALPALALAKRIRRVLFMHNHANGFGELVAATGERCMLGFPGASGSYDGERVAFALVQEQHTTIGECGRSSTPRTREIRDTFARAGFATDISKNMDAWLKTHALFVTAVAGALLLAGGDSRRLGASPAIVALFADGVRQGFRALGAIQSLDAAFNLRTIFCYVPKRVTISYWSRLLGSEKGELYFAAHVRRAPAEMKMLCADLRTLLAPVDASIPALRDLWAAVDGFEAAT